MIIGLILKISWIVWDYMFINIFSWIIMPLGKEFCLDISIVHVMYVLHKVMDYMLDTFVMLNVAKSMGRF